MFRAEGHLACRDELPECFAECLASGLATLVQSHLQQKSEGHGCQFFQICIVERVAYMEKKKQLNGLACDFLT